MKKIYPEKELSKYRAIYKITTSLFESLDGLYEFNIKGHKYRLLPCELTDENSQQGTSNFVLDFEFDFTSTLEDSYTHWELFEASQLPAIEFVAWLSCASRRWLKLPYRRTGFSSGTIGPSYLESIDSFDEERIKQFNVKKELEKGQFIEIKRPDLSHITSNPTERFKIPIDFLDLTKKLYSLNVESFERFLNACLCYQYALDNWFFTPTLSLVLLVSSIESMVWDKVTSQYCEYAERQCNNKKDIMKKFRAFFKEQLHSPLPPTARKFINSIYSGRSKYLHQSLMGNQKLRFLMPTFIAHNQIGELKDSLLKLESLVNASLINWLKTI